MAETDKAGWGWPGAAAKPHYFLAGDTISLCGKWMYTGPRDQENSPGRASDCSPCGKKLASRAVS